MSAVKLSESSLDVDALANNVYLGPQGEILEMVDSINEQYEINIGINKKFGFKPGVYDAIRDILNKHWLQWDRRCSSIENLFYKHENREWTRRNIRNKFKGLENKLREMRADNRTWQDNTDEVKVALEHLKKKLNINDNNGLIEGLSMGDPVLITPSNIKYSYIKFPLSISAQTLEVFNSNYTKIQEIPIESIDLEISINLIKALNVYSVERNRADNISLSAPRAYISYYRPVVGGETIYRNSIGVISRYNTDNIFQKHPFVSARVDGHDNTVEQLDMFRGQCFGDLHSMIMSNVWSLDIPSLMYNLKSWSSKYVTGVTNPLNQVDKTFYGIPSYLTKEYLDIQGARMDYDCPIYEEGQRNNYIDDNTTKCDAIECQLREDCKYYVLMTTGQELTCEQQGRFGDLYFNIIGIQNLDDDYYAKAVSDAEHINGDYNVSLSNLKSKYFTDMIELAAEYDTAAKEVDKDTAISILLFKYVRWSDWDDLEAHLSNRGISFPYSEQTLTEEVDEAAILERIARLGNNVPINIRPEESTTIVNETTITEVPF